MGNVNWQAKVGKSRIAADPLLPCFKLTDPLLQLVEQANDYCIWLFRGIVAWLARNWKSPTQAITSLFKLGESHLGLSRIIVKSTSGR